MNNNAQQTADDERLARQLQEMEMAGQGHPPAGGAPPVVRGVAVAGPGGGMPMAGGAGYAPGYPAYAQGYAPGQAVPVAIGAPTPGMAVVVEPELPLEEQQVLSYRCSLKCFAGIDAVSTLMNTVSVIMAAQRGNAEEARTSFFGHQGLLDESPLSYTILACTGLIFLAGPLCGWVGAQKLNRGLVLVYLAFCLMKAVFEVTIAVLSPQLWLILLAFIQVWVAKIVYTFWRALGVVPKERLEQLQRPEMVYSRPARMVYW